MPRKVLVATPYMHNVIDRYRPLFDEHDIELIIPTVDERLEEDELLPLMGDIDGVIAGDDGFTERVLEKSVPKLKVISKWGTGIDSIDQEACKRLGITVCNTPNAFSEPVADSVLGYMLCFARTIPQSDQLLKSGGWGKVDGKSLGECTLGVIGVGNIGKAVVRRARVFGMRLLGNDIVDMSAEFLQETGIEMMSKEELLRQSDFVSINCDLNPTSHHIMSTAEFDLMKPEAVLLNLSRGPLVDEKALVTALQEKSIAGAGLDVFEFEPLPEDSPLRQMDNVLLSGHNANSSPQAWDRVHESTVNQLLTVLNEKS